MKPALISHAWQGEEDVVVRTKLSKLSDLRSSVTVAWLLIEGGACSWVLWCCDKVVIDSSRKIVCVLDDEDVSTDRAIICCVK
jgi:hypothetical protein